MLLEDIYSSYDQEITICISYKSCGLCNIVQNVFYMHLIRRADCIIIN